MILIEDIEDKSFLMRLIKEMYEVLPAPKVKKESMTDSPSINRHKSSTKGFFL